MFQPTCPLCTSANSQFYFQDMKREYYQCPACDLVFVPDQYLPSITQEKQEYDLHQNDGQDDGYRTFLSRIAQPLLGKLPPSSTGLDYGCGPTPLLAQMLDEAGHHTDYWDPIYWPMHPDNPDYCFITCSEAIEHFHYPMNAWQDWMSWLKPQGWLAIMTKRVIDAERFATWHYKNDPTHVRFYSEATFHWLAEHFNLSLEFASKDVVLMQKLA